MYRDDPPVVPRSTDASLPSPLGREPSAISENTQPILLVDRQEQNDVSLAVHSQQKRLLRAALDEAILIIQRHG